MHLERCTVCEGSGQVIGPGTHSGSMYAQTCHGCYGKGQVVVPDEPRPLIVLPPIVIKPPDPEEWKAIPNPMTCQGNNRTWPWGTTWPGPN